MWVNNLPRVATHWNSGATRESSQCPRVRIPSEITTKSSSQCCLLMSNSTRDARHFAVTDRPRWPLEDSTVLHVHERLFVPAHSETSKFNNSASSHRFQTCLWPVTVALLYHNIHYTRDFCHFSLKNQISCMSVTGQTVNKSCYSRILIWSPILCLFYSCSVP